MPIVEIEDNVLAAFVQNGVQFKDASDRMKRGADLEAAWNKLLAGPNRVQVLEAYKLAYPEAVVPELDAAKPLMSEIEKLRKEMQDDKDARAAADEKRRNDAREASANDTVSKGRTWLRGEKKLDDEGVTAVEKIMLDEGIQNYAVAFNHWKALQPPDPEPLPSTYGGARSLDWFKVEEDRPDTKLLINDPKAFQRRETGKVLQEIRDGKLAAA